jgi:hypothetical protein
MNNNREKFFTRNIAQYATVSKGKATGLMLTTLILSREISQIRVQWQA